MLRTLCCLVLLMSTPAFAGTDENTWLESLTTDVIADLAAGKPIVVEVHVPLCESTIIPCGNAKLGDGNNPKTNLYWSTGPGFGVWFARRGSGWTQTRRTTTDTGDPDVLELIEYSRTVSAPAAWRKQGAPKRFEVHLVLRAWRGTAIDRALDTYAAAVSGKSDARIVAFVGHNRLMDLDTYQWPAPGTATKGTIAIACHTAAYMERDVPAPTRVPLLMTKDFLFSNAAPLEAAVLAFVRGDGYRAIRRDAAAAYATVQKRDAKRMIGVFTNPSDPRWARD
jgi:hypothetical protein